MENKDKEQVLQVLDQHRRELIAKREKLAKPLQLIDEELEHVTATITSLQRSTERAAEPSITPDFPIGKLRGLTQVQALTVIANANNGIVRAQDAKRLMIRAGVMRETKNSTNIIHAVIIRSGKFERVGTGTYKLISASPAESRDSALFPKMAVLEDAARAAFSKPV